MVWQGMSSEMYNYDSIVTSENTEFWVALSGMNYFSSCTKMKTALASIVEPNLIPINGGPSGLGARCVRKWLGEDDMDR